MSIHLPQATTLPPSGAEPEAAADVAPKSGKASKASEKSQKGEKPTLSRGEDLDLPSMLKLHSKNGGVLTKPKLDPPKELKGTAEKKSTDSPAKQSNTTTTNKTTLPGATQDLPSEIVNKNVAESLGQDTEATQDAAKDDELEDIEDSKNEQKTPQSKNKKDATKLKKAKTMAPATQNSPTSARDNSTNKAQTDGLTNRNNEGEADGEPELQTKTADNKSNPTKNSQSPATNQAKGTKTSNAPTANAKGATNNQNTPDTLADPNKVIKATTLTPASTKPTESKKPPSDSEGDGPKPESTPKSTSVSVRVDALKNKIHLLSTLAANYAAGRGSYAAKILELMTKVKKMKSESVIRNLKNQGQDRQTANARRTLQQKELIEKRDDMKNQRGIMKILSVVGSIVAVIGSVITVVLTAGAAIPLLVLAIVALVASVVGVALAIADLPGTGGFVDGVEMGALSRSVYKSAKKSGDTAEEARKKTSKILMGIQMGFAALGLVGGIAGGIAGASIHSTIKLSTQLLFRVMRHVTTTFQAVTGMTTGTITAVTSHVHEDMAQIQKDLKDLDAFFEMLEFDEGVIKDMMKDNVSAVEEFVNIVIKILDAEYKMIASVNRRSKIA